MPADALREALRSRAGLARSDHLEPAPRLVAHGLVEGQRPLLVRREAVGAHAVLREAREVVRQRDRGRARRARWYEPVHESHAERLVAADAPAGEDEVHRVTHADEPRQPHGPEIAERDTEAAAVDAEDGIRRGDAEIAPQRELEPAGHRVALDGGDHRLAEQKARRTERAVTVLGERSAAPARERLQIGPRAERPAGAGQHGDGVLGALVEG